MKFSRQRRIREIVPLRAEVCTQHLEDLPASFRLAFLAKPAKRTLYHRRRPCRVEKSFCRPGTTRFPAKTQLRRRLCYPGIPRNEADAAAAFAGVTSIHRVI